MSDRKRKIEEFIYQSDTLHEPKKQKIHSNKTIAIFECNYQELLISYNVNSALRSITVLIKSDDVDETNNTIVFQFTMCKMSDEICDKLENDIDNTFDNKNIVCKINSNYSEESKLIGDFIKLITEYNPTFITGYGITFFDLNNIIKKCERFGVSNKDILMFKLEYNPNLFDLHKKVQKYLCMPSYKLYEVTKEVLDKNLEDVTVRNIDNLDANAIIHCTACLEIIEALKIITI
jgi:DNA polymerase elongation subunit (family B)